MQWDSLIELPRLAVGLENAETAICLKIAQSLSL